MGNRGAGEGKGWGREGEKSRGGEGRGWGKGLGKGGAGDIGMR